MKPLNNQVIDLGWTRKKEMSWLDGHEIDKKLLFECAYYPKAPAFGLTVSSCVNCKFEKPIKKCPYSHILTLVKDKSKNKIKKDILRLVESLSEEECKAVEEFLRSKQR